MENLLQSWIDVEAVVPEGALPEGSSLFIEQYLPEEKDQAEFDQKLNDALEGALLEHKTISISFLDAAGEPVVPLKEIQIFVKDSMIKDAENIELVQIDDEKKNDLITYPVILDEEENAETDEDVLTYHMLPEDPAVLAVASTTLEKTLTAEGDDYSIAVNCSAKAGIPEGSRLAVKEIQQTASDYQGYVSDTEKALNVDEGKVSYARFFDITIIGPTGWEIQPQQPVDVKITLNDLQDNVPEEDTPQVVHFGEEGEEVTAEQDGDEVSFEAEGFSVYGVVYTVDFEYSVNGKMYQFSLPGGGFVSFTDLVEVLGIIGDTNSGENGDENGSVITENAEENAVEIVGTVDENATNEEAEENGVHSDTNTSLTLGDVVVSDASKKFVADVASVEFSNPELVDVSKVDADTTVGQIKESRGLEVEYSAELTEEQIAEINAQTVEARDWALISMQPFTSEETLTVTMKNGEVVTIRVTDYQISTNVLTADGQT